MTYKKHCKITHDGIVDEGDFMLGLITNSISVAGTQPGVIKKSSLNDGVFEALLIKANPSPMDVAEMIAAFNGNRDHCNGVLTFQFKKLRLNLKMKYRGHWMVKMAEMFKILKLV